MFRRVQLREAVFQPAAVGSDETKNLIPIAKGECVVGAWLQLMIAAATATGSTLSIGDIASVNGFFTTAGLDLETGTVGNLVDSNGANFAATKMGQSYNAADAIKAVYTASGTPGATNPKVKLIVAVFRVVP